MDLKNVREGGEERTKTGTILKKKGHFEKECMKQKRVTFDMYEERRKKLALETKQPLI